MKKERYRKFQCGHCGWRSSSFGSRYHINQEKLKEAQLELDIHYRDKHPEIYDHPGLWKLEVVYT